MGNFSSIFKRFLSRKQEVRILMVGLENSGKTSILNKLKGRGFVATVPTIGLNVEAVEYKNIKFTVIDVGGHEKVRPLWRHYYKGANAVIFVVDSDARDRLSEAEYELQILLREDELKDAVLLIFGNKQDLPNATCQEALASRFGLSSQNDRKWHIQSSCAITGAGLFEGLDWLSSMVGR